MASSRFLKKTSGWPVMEDREMESPIFSRAAAVSSVPTPSAYTGWTMEMNRSNREPTSSSLRESI